MITQYKDWEVWGHGPFGPFRTITSQPNVHLHNNWKKTTWWILLCLDKVLQVTERKCKTLKSNIVQSHIPLEEKTPTRNWLVLWELDELSERWSLGDKVSASCFLNAGSQTSPERRRKKKKTTATLSQSNSSTITRTLITSKHACPRQHLWTLHAKITFDSHIKHVTYNLI